jgi:hypothetical protein
MYTPFEIFPPFTFYSNPYPAERSRRVYLAAAAEQEADRRRRRYLEEQAYLKEIERLRRQRAFEEEQERKRQMQLFLYRQADAERRRREKEEEQERLRRAAAVLAYEKKRKEQERQMEALRRQNLYGLDYQLIQGPDGRLYKLLLEPTSSSKPKRFISKQHYDDMLELRPLKTKMEEDSDDNDQDESMDTTVNDHFVPNLITENNDDDEQDDDNYHDDTENDENMDIPSSSAQVPIFKHVVFNNCFNQNSGRAPEMMPKNGNNTEDTLAANLGASNGLKTTISTTTNLSSTPSTDFIHKKKAKKSKNSKKKKKMKKINLSSSESVLVGDVEDASDSECEDEYKDYWHTRRPEHGWIEPVDFFNLIPSKNKKQ